MEHLTIKIHWKGPYTLDEIDELSDGNGLYLLAGKQKYQREDDIQYFGITEREFRKRFKEHHKIPYITRDLQIWLGKIVYPNMFDRSHLETAESIIIYFSGTDLNVQGRFTLPKPTTVISHWFKKDGLSPRVNQKSIYKYFHDVISWDGNHWRTGNLVVYQE